MRAFENSSDFHRGAARILGLTADDRRLHAPSGFIFPDSSDHGPFHLEVQQFGWISLERILSEHDQVSELSRLNGTLQIFLEGRVCAIDRAAADCP